MVNVFINGKFLLLTVNNSITVHNVHEQSSAKMTLQCVLVIIVF